MVLNPFKAIFPKKNAYETNKPTTHETQFSSELSPDSAQFSTGFTNAASSTATTTGMSTAKIATLAGVSATMATVVLAAVISTSIILTATKSTSLLGYMSNCTATSQCDTNIGLSCINGNCICNSTQHYNGTSCGINIFLKII